jgi:hypothetical protein
MAKEGSNGQLRVHQPYCSGEVCFDLLSDFIDVVAKSQVAHEREELVRRASSGLPSVRTPDMHPSFAKR